MGGCARCAPGAAWVYGASPVIFPNVRPDLDTAGLQALAEHLTLTAPDKRVILNEGMAPTDSAPWEVAGWVLDTHAVGAETDLTARSWPLDPRVQERPVAGLLAPDLLELYAELVTAGKIGDRDETDPVVAIGNDLQDEEKRLFVLLEDGVALGAAMIIPAPPGKGRATGQRGVAE